MSKVQDNYYLGCVKPHMIWQVCDDCRVERKEEAKEQLIKIQQKKKDSKTIRKFDKLAKAPHVNKINEDGWTLSAKCLKRRFVNDCKRKPPVKGQGDLEDFNFSLPSVIDFASHLEVEQDANGLGYYTNFIHPFKTFLDKRLRSTNSLEADRAKLEYLNEIEDLTFKNGDVYLEDMVLKKYPEAEKAHKMLENHHPDGNFISTVWSSFEAAVDVFLSIQSQVPTVKAAWKIWLSAMASPKFEKLDPKGVYYFLLYVNKYKIAYGRITNRSKLFSDVGDFGIVAEIYYDATVDHVLAVNSVLKLARCPLVHDWSKFDPSQFIPYLFKWTVFESHKPNIYSTFNRVDGLVEKVILGTKTSADNVCRYCGNYYDESRYPSGCPCNKENRPPNRNMDFIEGFKTSLGEKIADGAAGIGKKIFGDSLEKLDDLTTNANSTIESAKKAVTGMLEKFQSMISSFAPIKQMADTFMTTIGEWFQQFKINVGSFGAISYTYLFSLYLVFINSENLLIKTACVFLIFDKLGLTTAIAKVIMGKDIVEDEEEEENTFEDANETHDEVIEIERKFEELSVVTDGRCLYHSLAILLNFSRLENETESEWIDRYMFELMQLPTLTTGEAEDIANKRWGTDSILQKVAIANDVDIVIVTNLDTDDEDEVQTNDGHPKLYIKFANNHWSPLRLVVEGVKTSAPEIVSFILDLITKGFSASILPTLASVLGVFFLGKLISPSHYKDLGEFVTHTMRNFHFVGGGLLGIERVLKYSTEILKSIFLWVRSNIFGITDETLALEKRIHKLIQKASFFSTSAGIGVIKADMRCRECAAGLFPEYMDIANTINLNPNSVSKDMLIAFRRAERNVQSVYNLCHRISTTSGFRPTAYHIQFVGKPGIGKTSLLKEFSSKICSEMYSYETASDKLPVYAYNPNEDFWSGYSSQKIVLIDDIFRMNDPKHMSLLIGIITNAPISLPMPNLEDKETMFESDVLISTTNTPYPKVKDIYCIEAVYRRRHMLVKVECDPDCYDNDKGQVDLPSVVNKYVMPLEEVKKKLPHLRFRLLKPIPDSAVDEADLPQYLQELEERKEGLKEAMKHITKINKYAMAQFGDLSDLHKTALYLNEASGQMKDAGLKRTFRVYTFEEMFQEFKTRSILMRKQESGLGEEDKKMKIYDCWLEFDQQFDSSTGLDPSSWKKHFCDLVYETPELISPDAEDVQAAEEILKEPLADIYPIVENLGEDIVEGEKTVLDVNQEEQRRKRILKSRNRNLKSVYNKPFLNLVGTGIVLEDHPGSGLDLSKVRQAGCLHQYDISKLMMLIEADLLDQRPISTGAGDLTCNFLSSITYDNSQGYTRYIYNPSPFIKNKHMSIIYEDSARFINCTELYALSPSFCRLSSIFMNLPDDRRKRLVDKAQKYVVLFGTNPMHALDKAARGIADACGKTYKIFSDVLEWSFDMFKAKWKHVLAILTFAGIIYAARSMASLVLGTTTSTKPSHNIQKAHVVWGAKTTKLMIDQFLEGVASNNVISFVIQSKSGMKSSAHGFKEGQFLLTVAHAVPDEPFLVNFPPTPNHPDGWTHHVEPYQVAKSKNGDKALIFLPTTSFARSNVSHFFKRADIEKYDPFGRTSYLMKVEGNVRTIIPRSPHQATKNLFFKDFNDGDSFVSDSGLMLCELGIKGDSGATFVIENPEAAGLRVIYGIQSFSPKSGGTYIQSVTQEDFSELKEQIVQQCLLHKMKTPIQQQGPITSVYEDGDVVEGEGTTAKAARLITEHVLPVYSVKKGFIVGQVGKTKFKESPIAVQMRLDGLQSKRKPACFNYDPVTQIDPLAHSLNKSGRHVVGPWNMELLRKARQGVYLHLKSLLPDRKYRTDLTPQEIVEGLRVDGSNPMATNTSPGIPYVFTRPAGVKGKHDLMEMSEFGDATLTSEFIADFELFYHDLSTGVIPYHTSYDFPKDELRPVEKAATKTRIVTTLNVCVTMAWRRVVNDLMADLHVLAKGETPFAPGMNPMGTDWTTMFHYLNKFKNAVDFDVNNWDGHFPPEIAYECAQLLCDLIEVEKNSPEGNVIFSIITEVLFGHVQFKDLIYQKQRGLQSGFPGTAELNTLAHFILDIYIYLYIMSQAFPNHANIESYFMFVRNKIYGDDIIKTISDVVLHWYNGLSIASVYEMHGYPVSSADKDSQIQMSKPLMECQFLKSKFRVVSVGRVERLIDWSTIHDLCYWYRSNFQGEEQFRQNLLDAARFVHPYGSLLFNAWINQVNKWLKKAKQEPFIITWETLEAEFVSNNYFTHSVLRADCSRGAIDMFRLQ